MTVNATSAVVVVDGVVDMNFILKNFLIMTIFELNELHTI